MANDNTIKTFTALDIEKYHKGQLSPKEMHAMEKAALDDPFLADALEGYTVPGVNAEADIAELKKRLEERTSRNKVIPIAPAHKSSFPWMKAAAMFILIAGAGFLVYKFGFTGSDTDNIAKAPADQSTNQSIPYKNSTDSGTVAIADSLSSGNTDGITSITSGIGAFKRIDAEISVKASEELKQERSINDDIAGITPGVITTNTDTAKNYNLDFYAKSPTAKKNPLAPQSNNAPPAALYDKSKDLSRNRQDENILKLTTPGKPDSTQFKYKADGSSAWGYLAKEKERPAASQNMNRQGMMAPRHNVFRGRVIDANNNPLPFANITNSVDNVGTYSDSKGNFTLISPDSVLNVQVRSVGFENNASVLVAGPRDNQVVMQEDNRSLSEVVINSNSRAGNVDRRARNNTIVHEEPEPVDGWVNYDIYVANNLKLPDTLQRMKVQRGSVELSFDISKNGEPVNITVDKSLCDSCDKEAIRLLKEGPKWKQKSRRTKRTSVTISF